MIVKDTGRRFGLLSTLPNLARVSRVHTESEPSLSGPFFLSSRPFSHSPVSCFRNPTVFTIYPLNLFCPNYMSSYRKTMPSFTLVLTSGHPSFHSPTIQPSSAMLPTAPDFLMVHICPTCLILVDLTYLLPENH